MSDYKQSIVYPIEKILDVIFAFNSEPRYEALLEVLITKMMEITNADAGTLYIQETGKLNFRIVKNRSLNINQSIQDTAHLPPITLDANNIKNVSAYAAIYNEIVCVDDVYENEKFNFSGPKEYDKLTGYRTKSMLVMPLCSFAESEGECLGVIQLINALDPQTGEVTPFSNLFELSVITALSNIAANTLANMMHMREINMMFSSLVAVTTQAIDERSVYNKHHTQNVAYYCSRFSEFLRDFLPEDHPLHFNEEMAADLVLAASLHDIGKIITPRELMDKHDRLGTRLQHIRTRFTIKAYQDEIDMLKKNTGADEYHRQKIALNETQRFIEELNSCEFIDDETAAKIPGLKSIKYRDENGDTVSLLTDDDIEALSIRRGTFTEKERKAMQEHVIITGRLLDSITFWKYYKNVPRWAKSHHEFMDGSGYPSGLSGDEIPTGSCIITIVDIFDALVARDRPYKKGMPVERALHVLQSMADKGKLHEDLVKLFIQSGIWKEAENR